MSILKIPKKIQKTFSTSLSDLQELPDNLLSFVPYSAESQQDIDTAKSLPSTTNLILHKERSFTQNELPILQSRLKYFDKINIVDFTLSSGSFALPLIFELLESRQMGQYTAVSAISVMNDYNTHKMRLFSIEAGLPKFPVNSIYADIEYENCKEQLTKIYKSNSEDKKVSNLFLVMNSGLGRFLSPESILHNIHATMEDKDHLVVVQGLYRPGCEDSLVFDYTKIVPGFNETKIIAEKINPNGVLKVKWSQQIQGIQIYVEVEKPTTFLDIDLYSGQQITLCRNVRFEEIALREKLEKCGFKIIQVAYNDSKDYSIILLQKA